MLSVFGVPIFFVKSVHRPSPPPWKKSAGSRAKNREKKEELGSQAWSALPAPPGAGESSAKNFEKKGRTPLFSIHPPSSCLSFPPIPPIKRERKKGGRKESNRRRFFRLFWGGAHLSTPQDRRKTDVLLKRHIIVFLIQCTKRYAKIFSRMK